MTGFQQSFASGNHHVRFAAAFVRGKALQNLIEPLPEKISAPDLDALSMDDCDRVYQLGLEVGLRLHKFKRTMGLARVNRVLGTLRGLMPADLLDIGSGRGVFLWPLLDAFPQLPVTAIDHSEQRALDLQAVRLGGLARLTPLRMDATRLDFADDAFDVVTFLEVLEHIPDAPRALAEAVRVARRFVLLSVPSKEDDNPEHIHLFDERRLRALFAESGVRKVRFDYVPGHLLAVANVVEK